jgi:hypothetical protein
MVKINNTLRMKQIYSVNKIKKSMSGLPGNKGYLADYNEQFTGRIYSG